MMNILGWNVTGINQPGQSESIHQLVRMFNPVMVGLVDTKHSRLTEEKVKGWWKEGDKVGWIDVPETRSNGEKSEGMVFAWNERYFTKSRSLTNKRWILVEGKLLQKRIDVGFLLVFEPSCSQEKANLRKDLTNLVKTISHPFMMMGKFKDGSPPDEQNVDFRVSADPKFSERFKFSTMSGLETGLSDHCPNN